MWFEEAPYCGLPSAEALGDLEATAAGGVYISQGDVECCFYQFELPQKLKQYFGLPLVRGRFLPPSLRHRLGVGLDEEVRFRCRVIPMGWSWAVKWVQEIHQEVFRRACIPGPWILDKRPTSGVDESMGAKALYIDNFASFEVSGSHAEDQRDKMLKALADAGIVAHSEGETTQDGDFLGFSLVRGDEWRLSRRRFWKIVLALR